MKIIKLVIIILLIATIGIVGLMFMLNLRNQDLKNIVNLNPSNNYIKNEQTNFNINEEGEETKYITGEYGPELTFNTTIQEVISNSEMYNISQNITRYYNYIKDNNINAINELGGAIEYNIYNNVKFIAKKVFVTSNEYQSKYYIKGNLIQFTGNSITSEQEKYIIMYIDLNNNSYKVEESTNEQFQNIDKLSDEEKTDIVNGNYNKYEYTYIDGVRQLELYLEDYAFYLVNDIDRSYNLLNEEYRAKRFKDINEFKEYVLNNQSRLQNVEITQYNILNEDDYTIYIGTDEYGNYYKVIVKSYMDYTIILDNYTIIDEYDELDDDEKIKINIERFISMLNSKDYTNAYNLLETNFKETYFRTEQDFINYIQQNFFERNIISSKELNEERICIVNIRETISTRSNKIEKTFKVNLLEEEFNIEFDV